MSSEEKVEKARPRRVVVGTPVHAGEFLYIWYVDALMATMHLARERNIEIVSSFTTGELEHCRNKVIQWAVERECDDVFFIDSDIGWLPEDFFRVLDWPEEVVSGAYVRRIDSPSLVFRTLRDEKPDERGLVEIAYAGTGFMRIRRSAFTRMYEKARPYTRAGDRTRAVFEYRMQDEMLSEDIMFCRRWQSMRGKMFLDTKALVYHCGPKRFECKAEYIAKMVKERNGE